MATPPSPPETGAAPPAESSPPAATPAPSTVAPASPAPNAPPASTPEPLAPKPPAPESAPNATVEDLIEAGRTWIQENLDAANPADLAPAEADKIAHVLQPVADALASGDLERIAAVRPQAAELLTWLHSQPWGEPYADWLAPRMDYLEMAAEAIAAASARPPEPVIPNPPGPAPAEPRRFSRPTLRLEVARDRLYRTTRPSGVWRHRLAQLSPPSRAAALTAQIKEVFRAQGLPVELIWLAEVESSFDPEARSPAGARGLFQLMPATAERFGLSTAPVDDRLDPDKNARAAARYLRILHNRFSDWPLALAAYNAGENRVGRELAASKTRSFDAIAEHLPAETRFYVPKVLATVAAREGVDPFALPAPTAPPGPLPVAAGPAAAATTN